MPTQQTKTVAWGAGEFFQRVSHHPGFRIDRLVDLEPAKWGTTVLGYTVEDPLTVIPDLSPSSTVILIYAHRAVADVRRQLSALGPFLSVDMSELSGRAAPDNDLAYIKDSMRWARSDMIAAAEVLATQDSAMYLVEHMADVPIYDEPFQMLGHMARSVTGPGLFVEFGVASGKTIQIIAGTTDRTVWGFDSFEGLPEPWKFGCPRGSFACAIPTSLPANVKLVVGMIQDTLGPFLEEHREPMAFIHMDVDLYSSCLAILTCATPRIHPGTIIVFDEYLNYPGWRQHEYRAFQEFIALNGLKYRYVGFVRNCLQVAVQVL